MIIQGKSRDLGGFSVKRILPAIEQKMVGPFVFLDEMGPASFEINEGIDVRPHPHIGLSTLTYLFQGRILHRDSLGTEQEIAPGDVNWMTAGSGIVHSERSPKELRQRGHKLHGLQFWVALPDSDEECAPTFMHYPKASIPHARVDGFAIDIIAGQWGMHQSPVKVFSPLVFLNVHAPEDASSALHFNPQFDLGVYVISGSLTLGDLELAAGNFFVMEQPETLQVSSDRGCHFVVIGGERLQSPRILWWNFVASSQDKINRAKDRWNRQEFGKIPGEQEFIPLPTPSSKE